MTCLYGVVRSLGRFCGIRSIFTCILFGVAGVIMSLILQTLIVCCLFIRLVSVGLGIISHRSTCSSMPRVIPLGGVNVPFKLKGSGSCMLASSSPSTHPHTLDKSLPCEYQTYWNPAYSLKSSTYPIPISIACSPE